MQMLRAMSGKIEEMNGKIGAMTEEQGTMNGKIDAMNGKIDAMAEEMNGKIDAMAEEMNGKIDAMTEDIRTFVSPLYSIQAVSEDVVTQLTDGTFNETARELYGTSSCVILGQLFSSSTHEQEKYCSRFFRAVAEHIVPKAQWTVAVNWGFQATDARNALFLLKHVELKYQAGHLSLIPDQFQAPAGEDRVRLVVEISKAHMDTIIRYKGHRDGEYYDQPVWGRKNGVGELTMLRFGDLHGETISVHPRPHMRALFLKADMAHRQHPELTSPFHIRDRYTSYCPQMRRGLLKRLLKVDPTELMRLRAEEEHAERAGSP